MAQNDRLNLFPSRANQVLMKQRIAAAQRGLNLLKRKRDALEMKLRALKGELRATKALVPEALREAFFSMARARYLRTDFKPASVMGADRADAYMRIVHSKVAGLQLPLFELIMHPPSCYPLTGLAAGGIEVETMRQKFQEALRVLIKMASLEYSVHVLQEGVKLNNMRVNGLDYVVIPRFINTFNYIRNELEEYEREDFFRLKRSQAMQRKIKAAQHKLLDNRTEDGPIRRTLIPKSNTFGMPEVVTDNFDMDNFLENLEGSPVNRISMRSEEQERSQ